MPSFQNLLVLSVLALSLSVQSAPVKTVVTRDVGHASRFAEPDIVSFDDVEAREFDEDEDTSLEARAKKHHKVHHKSTKPKGKGHKGHKSHKGKGIVGGILNDLGMHGDAGLNVEVREFDEDEDTSLEARAKKHHQAHHKSTKPKGKGLKGHKGKGGSVVGGLLGDMGLRHHGHHVELPREFDDEDDEELEAREFDEDEESTLEAHAKKHHKGHKSTKPKGKGLKGHKGKGGGLFGDLGLHHHGHHVELPREFDDEDDEDLEAREFDDDEENTLEARAKKHHHAHHKSTKPKGHKGHKGKGGSLGGLGVGLDGHGHLNVGPREFDDEDLEDLEAREFDDDEDVSLEARAKKHHKAHHKSTKPKGKGHKGHKSHKGKGGGIVGGILGDLGVHGDAGLNVEVREFDEDEDESLEARSSKHHHAHHKLTKPEGKGHKGHEGKGHEGKGGDRVDGGGHHHVEAREFDEDEENSLEARAKKHHKAHHKSTKPKGKGHKGHKGHGGKGDEGKGGSVVGGLLGDIGLRSLADIDE